MKRKINPKVGKRLQIVCNEQGLTQTQMGELIHVSQQQVGRIINGKSGLTNDNANLIVEKFPNKYRLEWLLGTDDTKSPNDYFDKIWLKAKTDRETLVSAFRRLAKEEGYEVNPCFSVTGPGGPNYESFIIRKGVQQSNEIVLDDLIEEACNFIGYMLNKKMGG